MSLNFTGGDTDKVNVGSGSSLDNMTAGTLLCWCRPTSITPGANRWLWQKGTEPGQRIWTFANSSNQMAFELYRATAITQIQAALANFSAASANAWLFCAVAFDTAGANGDQKFYVGNLTTLAAEPSSYATQAVGSGALSSDAAANGNIGNHPSNSFSFGGDIAWFGIYSSVLTQAQIQSLQFRPRVLANTLLFTHLGFAGTGTQPDWSGNLNNGTVTGATVSSHVPIGPPFGFDLGWMGAFTAAAAAGRILIHPGMTGGMEEMLGGLRG